jgi:hypothetical protein
MCHVATEGNVVRLTKSKNFFENWYLILLQDYKDNFISGKLSKIRQQKKFPVYGAY